MQRRLALPRVPRGEEPLGEVWGRAPIAPKVRLKSAIAKALEKAQMQRPYHCCGNALIADFIARKSVSDFRAKKRLPLRPRL